MIIIKCVFLWVSCVFFFQDVGEHFIAITKEFMAFLFRQFVCMCMCVCEYFALKITERKSEFCIVHKNRGNHIRKQFISSIDFPDGKFDFQCNAVELAGILFACLNPLKSL